MTCLTFDFVGELRPDSLKRVQKTEGHAKIDCPFFFSKKISLNISRDMKCQDLFSLKN